VESLSSLPLTARVTRIARLRLRPDAENAFFAIARRIVERDVEGTPGLVSLTVARELSGGHTDVLIISVWASVRAMQDAARGEWKRPMFPEELGPLVLSSSLDHFEVALYWDKAAEFTANPAAGDNPPARRVTL
jgi:heme-degrading monooxygenase HmoA